MTARIAALLLTMLSLRAGAQAPAAPPPVPPDVSPLYVATYIELRPSARDEGAAIVKAYRDASRAATGNLRAVAVQSQVASSDIQSVPGAEAVPAGPGAEADDEQGHEAQAAPPERPSLLRFEAGQVSEPPRVDAYALRLVSAHKLYDEGTLVQHSPSMAALAPGTRLRVSSHDLDRLGLRTGDRAKVSSARGSATIELEADDGIPRGSASLTFNQPGGVDAGTFIDVTQPVTELRIETV